MLHRTSLVAISIALSLLLGGQALACLSPSMQEMREDRVMACCAEHCRMETTPEAAKQACDQSRQAVIQDEPLLNQPNPYVSTTGKFLLDCSSSLSVGFAICTEIHPNLQIKEHNLSKKFVSVEIYTLFRSFLI